MAAKLRSILKTTHWSLLLKTAVVGGIWLATGSGFPRWLFVIVAFYCYCTPFFRISSMLFPWTVLLILGFLQVPTLPAALTFAFLCYGILGIKELSLVHRFVVHRIIALTLLLAIFLHFFIAFPNWDTSLALFGACGIGAITFLLLRKLAAYHAKEKGVIAAAIGGLILWQIAIAMLIMPFSFLYQSAFLFLVATILFELLPEGKAPERSRLKTCAIVFLVLALAIFGSAQWGI